jgi:HK97 family phage portal protein
VRLFGFDVTVTKATSSQQLLPPAPNTGWFDGWFNVIRESFPGAWQRNIEVRLDNVLTFSTVYSCVTLIASDMGKVGLCLVQEDDDGIWNEVDVPAYSPVLRKPNRYQTRQKFIEQWTTSKLVHGNTYVLKERDNRNVVVRMYVLDPQLTRPLIAPDGAIYYQVSSNRLAGIEAVAGIDRTEVTNGTLLIPQSEIIHDVMVPLYHPLCGVSPITACGLAAVQGINIQNNSTRFFENGSRPGGILTAPGVISDETAKRLKDHWEQNYTGVNAGKIAVLGDGLKYEGMTVNAVDADLINQLKWTSETVCSAFHVPPYMVGVGPAPSYNNIEALNQQYYSQCLQTLMEAIEALLDEGLALTDAGYGTEFELDDLLKMDTSTQFKTYGDGIKNGLLAPNEARLKINLPPIEGGDTVYMQQQNYSLEALNKRDTKADPFATAKPAPLPAPQPKPDAEAKPPAQKLLPDLRLDETAIIAAMMEGATDDYASI